LNECRELRRKPCFDHLLRCERGFGARRLAGQGLHLRESAFVAATTHCAEESDLRKLVCVLQEKSANRRRDRPGPNRRTDDDQIVGRRVAACRCNLRRAMSHRFDQRTHDTAKAGMAFASNDLFDIAFEFRSKRFDDFACRSGARIESDQNSLRHFSSPRLISRQRKLHETSSCALTCIKAVSFSKVREV